MQKLIHGKLSDALFTCYNGKCILVVKLKECRRHKDCKKKCGKNTCICRKSKCKVVTLKVCPIKN